MKKSIAKHLKKHVDAGRSTTDVLSANVQAMIGLYAHIENVTPDEAKAQVLDLVKTLGEPSEDDLEAVQETANLVDFLNSAQDADDQQDDDIFGEDDIFGDVDEDQRQNA